VFFIRNFWIRFSNACCNIPRCASLVAIAGFCAGDAGRWYVGMHVVGRRVPSCGLRCTKLQHQSTLRHTGWMAIRRRTAGGVPVIRTRTSSVFESHLPALKTDRATSTSNTLAKRMRVSLLKLNTYGRRVFSVAGSMAWNSLPDFIRDPTSSTDCFRRLLKTYLFARY